MDDNSTINPNPEPQSTTGDVVVERDEKGRIKPGFSGNPGGRPKKPRLQDYFSAEEIEELVLRVKQECKGDKTDILKMTVEQIFGKPKQPLVGGDEEDQPIKVEVSEKIAGKNKLYDSTQHSE
jgi:hypothetical protein